MAKGQIFVGGDERVEEEVIKTDVLVIGGGGAALRAAIEAKATKDVRVAVVSKSIMGSGNTRMSTANMCVPLDSPDGPDIHLQDTIKGGGYLNDQELAKTVIDQGRDQLMALERLGCVFRRQESMDKLLGESRAGHSYPRGRGALGEGLGIIKVLKGQATHHGVEQFEETMVTDLLTDGKGAVAGAAAIDLRDGSFKVFNAKVVILAAGGAGQVYRYSTNSTLNTGDGYAMAYRAGAELLSMEMVQFMPFTFVYPDSQKGKFLGEAGHYGPKAKLLNGKGERFMEKYDPERLERSTRDTVARAIFMEIMEGRGTPRNGVWLDMREGRDQLPFYKDRYLTAYLRIRDVYGPDEGEWQKPFEVMPSVHYFMGGVRVDKNYRSTLERLYAIGENAGGLHGGNRLGGNSILEVMVSGAMVGKTAAFLLKELDMPSPEKGGITMAKKRILRLIENERKGADPYAVRDKIKAITWEKAGIVREGKELEKGLGEIEQLREETSNMALANRSLRYNLELRTALEVENMRDISETIFRSALERKESRASHYRRDFPNRNDSEWLKYLVVFQDNGEMEIKAENVALPYLKP